MMDALYYYLRSAIGFSLLVMGAAFRVEPGKDEGYRYFGILFLAVGGLFTLSALDPLFHLPEAAGFPIVVVLILILSQALLGEFAYLFGDIPLDRKRMTVIGAAWSLLLCLIPYLDDLFGWRVVAVSVEDDAALGPLHAAASVAIYAWPIFVSIAALKSRSPLRSLRAKSRTLRVFSLFVAAASIVLLVIGIASFLGTERLYRAAQTTLEAILLVWFFAIKARPDCFERVHGDIQRYQEETLAMDEAEAAAIAAKLAKLANDGKVLFDPDLSLAGLARCINVPPYRLSFYFNRRLRTSFPIWINGFRTEWVGRRLLAEPKRGILDIAMDAGYASKTVFNEQFRRAYGVSPREFRRNAARGEAAGAGESPRSGETRSQRRPPHPRPRGADGPKR